MGHAHEGKRETLRSPKERSDHSFGYVLATLDQRMVFALRLLVLRADDDLVRSFRYAAKLLI